MSSSISNSSWVGPVTSVMIGAWLPMLVAWAMKVRLLLGGGVEGSVRSDVRFLLVFGGMTSDRLLFIGWCKLG